jgi:hypothetical protein
MLGAKVLLVCLFPLEVDVTTAPSLLELTPLLPMLPPGGFINSMFRVLISLTLTPLEPLAIGL